MFCFVFFSPSCISESRKKYYLTINDGLHLSQTITAIAALLLIPIIIQQLQGLGASKNTLCAFVSVNSFMCLCLTGNACSCHWCHETGCALGSPEKAYLPHRYHTSTPAWQWMDTQHEARGQEGFPEANPGLAERQTPPL